MDYDEFKRLSKKDDRLYFWILVIVAVIILVWLFYINNTYLFIEEVTPCASVKTANQLIRKLAEYSENLIT